jgi:hypothetical protein
MSYEPSAPPPFGGAPIAAPPVVGSPPPKRPHPGRAAIILGFVAIVGGLLVGIALAVVGVTREQAAVEDLARAPAGCATRLEFDRTGTFYVYVETAGTIADLGGSCPNDDRDYETDDDRPDLELQLVDEDGDEVDIDRASGTTYDTGGFAGRMIREFEIDDEGDYVLTVTSDDDEVVVAVGGDVGTIATPWVVGGFLLGVGGLIVGVVLLIVGVVRGRRARRARPPGAGAAPPPGASTTMPPPSPGTWQPPSVSPFSRSGWVRGQRRRMTVTTRPNTVTSEAG